MKGTPKIDYSASCSLNPKDLKFTYPKTRKTVETYIEQAAPLVKEKWTWSKNRRLLSRTYEKDPMARWNKSMDRWESAFGNHKQDVKEKDPNGKKPNEAGAKLDEGKILGGVIGDFGLALLEVAKVGTYGAKKYSMGGWQHVPDGVVRYTDAMWRHLLVEHIQTTDKESGLPTIAQVAWNALARLELQLRSKICK